MANLDTLQQFSSLPLQISQKQSSKNTQAVQNVQYFQTNENNAKLKYLSN